VSWTAFVSMATPPYPRGIVLPQPVGQKVAYLEYHLCDWFAKSGVGGGERVDMRIWFAY